LCKSCRTCFKFYCMFYFTCDRSLTRQLSLVGVGGMYRDVDRPLALYCVELRRPSDRCRIVFVAKSARAIGAGKYNMAARSRVASRRVASRRVESRRFRSESTASGAGKHLFSSGRRRASAPRRAPIKRVGDRGHPSP